MQWARQLQRSSQQLRWDPKDWAILQVWQQPEQRLVVGRFRRQCCLCFLQRKVRRWQHLLHPIYDQQRREYHYVDVDVTIDGGCVRAVTTGGRDQLLPMRHHWLQHCTQRWHLWCCYLRVIACQLKLDLGRCCVRDACDSAGCVSLGKPNPAIFEEILDVVIMKTVVWNLV